MAVTETTTESWGSRLGNSIKGVIVGLGLFVLGFPVLFWNEGNSVKTAKSLDEGEKACVSLESAEKVDPGMEGRLVHVSGKADTKDVLTDEDLLSSAGLEPPLVVRAWRELEGAGVVTGPAPVTVEGLVSALCE